MSYCSCISLLSSEHYVLHSVTENWSQYVRTTTKKSQVLYRSQRRCIFGTILCKTKTNHKLIYMTFSPVVTFVYVCVLAGDSLLWLSASQSFPICKHPCSFYDALIQYNYCFTGLLCLNVRLFMTKKQVRRNTGRPLSKLSNVWKWHTYNTILMSLPFPINSPKRFQDNFQGVLHRLSHPPRLGLLSGSKQEELIDCV